MMSKQSFYGPIGTEASIPLSGDCTLESDGRSVVIHGRFAESDMTAVKRILRDVDYPAMSFRFVSDGAVMLDGDVAVDVDCKTFDGKAPQ